jgi:hypothetical protein
MEQSLYRLRIHFFYCTVILVLTIIAIATDRWTLQPKFTEFLGNAATMTSLVLGLVAIFYSFIANDSLSKSLGSIGTVSESISSVRDQVIRQIEHGSETAKEVQDSAKMIERTSISLESSLSSLHASLAEISTSTQALHGSLENLPGKLDAIEATLVNSAKRSPSDGTALVQHETSRGIYSKNLIQLFFTSSSFACNLLALACVLANKTAKPLVISDMHEYLPDNLGISFIKGFLQCMNAANLIGLEEPFELDVAVVDWVDPVLAQEAQPYLDEFTERGFKEKHPEVYKRLRKAIDSVKLMFA